MIKMITLYRLRDNKKKEKEGEKVGREGLEKKMRSTKVHIHTLKTEFNKFNTGCIAQVAVRPLESWEAPGHTQARSWEESPKKTSSHKPLMRSDAYS